MVERLVIDRSAIAATASSTVPTARSMFPARCRAKPSKSTPCPAIPTGARFSPSRRRAPERVAPICPHFGICGGCALQHWQSAPYRAWKRDLVVTALRQAGIDAPVGDLIDAHGDGRRRVVFHARRGTHDVLEVGFSAARAHSRRDRPLSGAGQEPRRRAQAAWAIAEVLAPPNKPLDIQVTATDARPRYRRARLGPVDGIRDGGACRASPRQHKLARLTRHGELVAQARAPTLRIGAATVPLPPAAFLASHRRRRGGAGAAGARGLRRRQKRSPICSPASARSRCGLPSKPASPPSMTTSRPSPRSSARRPAQPGLKPDRRRAARSVQEPADGGRTQSLRCRRVRSAAPGRRRAVARIGGKQSADRRRGVVQSRHVCARHASFDRRRLSAREPLRRSINSAIRRMSKIVARLEK